MGFRLGRELGCGERCRGRWVGFRRARVLRLPRFGSLIWRVEEESLGVGHGLERRGGLCLGRGVGGGGR